MLFSVIQNELFYLVRCKTGLPAIIQIITSVVLFFFMKASLCSINYPTSKKQQYTGSTHVFDVNKLLL